MFLRNGRSESWSGRPWHLRRVGVVAVTVLVVVFLGACGSGGKSSSRTPPLTGAQADDPVLREGRSVFIASCTRCHGDEGQGAMGPQLAEGRTVDRYPDIQDQVAVVTNGRGSMPPFEGALTAEEIQAVVRYAREGL